MPSRKRGKCAESDTRSISISSAKYSNTLMVPLWQKRCLGHKLTRDKNTGEIFRESCECHIITKVKERSLKEHCYTDISQINLVFTARFNSFAW